MKPDTALRILGLSGSPTIEEIDDARRVMLATLHPDLHPGKPHAVFARLCSDVNEAHDTLTQDGVRNGLRDDEQLEQSLFHVSASAQWRRAVDYRGNAVAVFDKRYAKDKIVAVAVLGLDPRFSWSYTSWGTQTNKGGTALYVLVWNRTRRRVEGLDISEGLLVDDRGNQYSSEGGFYWTEGEGQFNKHATTLVPNAKLDGFLLYPALRTGASAFVRWYLADTIHIGDKYIESEYDVELPRDPQTRALLSTALTPMPDAEDLGDGGFDDGDPDEDHDDELDDDWLYEDDK